MRFCGSGNFLHQIEYFLAIIGINFFIFFLLLQDGNLFNQEFLLPFEFLSFSLNESNFILFLENYILLLVFEFFDILCILMNGL
jgi:hypothetical protein